MNTFEIKVVTHNSKGDKVSTVPVKKDNSKKGDKPITIKRK